MKCSDWPGQDHVSIMGPPGGVYLLQSTWTTSGVQLPMGKVRMLVLQEDLKDGSTVSPAGGAPGPTGAHYIGSGLR